MNGLDYEFSFKPYDFDDRIMKRIRQDPEYGNIVRSCVDRFMKGEWDMQVMRDEQLRGLNSRHRGNTGHYLAAFYLTPPQGLIKIWQNRDCYGRGRHGTVHAMEIWLGGTDLEEGLAEDDQLQMS